MTMSLEAAAQVMRDAMRETVRRHSLWYLVQGGLMVLGGILALVYPVLSTVAVLLLLGWILIITGLIQGISLIGARSVPHFEASDGLSARFDSPINPASHAAASTCRQER